MAEHVVVLDSGTDTVKAGFAGGGLDEKEPVLTTPSRAHVYPPGTAPAAGTAPGPQSGGVLACPLSRGAVDRWDVLEAIWHYCVFEQLGWIEGEEGGLMITCPLAWSRRDREVAAQIAFEGLNASSAFLADSGVCSLYSVGKVSGFAVDIGHGKIDVAGVSEVRRTTLIFWRCRLLRALARTRPTPTNANEPKRTHTHTHTHTGCPMPRCL